MNNATKFFALAALAAPVAGCAGASSSPVPATAARPIDAVSPALSPYLRVLPDGSMIHIHPLPAVRGAFAAAHPAIADRVEYHGGPIVKRSTLFAIYWRPTGSYMSPKYESVIDEYFQDVGATDQYGILTQYYDRESHVRNASAFGGSWTDTSPYPSDFTKGQTGDKDLHAEVLKAIAANNWPQGGIGAIFVVFTASQSPADKWAACAYHSSFAASATYVYSIVPYQHDYGAHGCGTPSNVWPNDRDADQTIDTLWHEQAESTSDPNTSGIKDSGGWYSNKTGREIGDLCETSYGPLRKDGSDTTLHDHRYVTQKMWSNLGDHCLQTMH